jgi:hypothetical protein
MMEIKFPDTPGMTTPMATVSFPAICDGKTVACEISAAALQDHFGAVGSLGPSLCLAFDRNRHVIELKAEQLLEESDGTQTLLQSSDFY